MIRNNIEVHPVQHGRSFQQGGYSYCPAVLTLKAYEVYCHLHGTQEAMVTGECRGGFSTGELLAFLYAHTFPKDEWRKRVQEAFEGMENIK